jgi:hypothetical protein
MSDVVVSGKTGQLITGYRPSISCIIDAHMHSQSGRCTPLPILYRLIKSQTNNFLSFDSRKRWTVEHLIGLFKAKAVRLSKLDCNQIACKALSDNALTYANAIESAAFAIAKTTAPADATATSTRQSRNATLFSLMITMLMDMEYAHIAGYDGQYIYHAEGWKIFYYKRASGLAKETDGQLKDISHDANQKEGLKLKIWKKQFEETLAAVIMNPWKLIPMFAYDPRRWNGSPLDDYHSHGPWNYPFQHVASATTPGVFIGFKMYTPMGFQPLDPFLPHLHDARKYGDCFYGRCEREGIPILNHASPGGPSTHEAPFYKEFHTKMANSSRVTATQSPDGNGFAPDATAVSQDDPIAVAERWFDDNFIHPNAWRKVLAAFPRLKLCLAHFGGSEWEKVGVESDWIQTIIEMTGDTRTPNVYTDISCWDIGNEVVRDRFRKVLLDPGNAHLKKKILFGTDWYMTMLTQDNGEYQEYCENWKKFLDTIDETLWIRFSFVNPFEFYGLGDEDKIDKMQYALIKSAATSDEVQNNYDKLLRLRSEVDKFKKTIGK